MNCLHTLTESGIKDGMIVRFCLECEATVLPNSLTRIDLALDACEALEDLSLSLLRTYMRSMPEAHLILTGRD